MQRVFSRLTLPSPPLFILLHAVNGVGSTAFLAISFFLGAINFRADGRSMIEIVAGAAILVGLAAFYIMFLPEFWNVAPSAQRIGQGFHLGMALFSGVLVYQAYAGPHDPEGWLMMVFWGVQVVFNLFATNWFRTADWLYHDGLFKVWLLSHSSADQLPPSDAASPEIFFDTLGVTASPPMPAPQPQTDFFSDDPKPTPSLTGASKRRLKRFRIARADIVTVGLASAIVTVGLTAFWLYAHAPERCLPAAYAQYCRLLLEASRNAAQIRAFDMDYKLESSGPGGNVSVEAKGAIDWSRVQNITDAYLNTRLYWQGTLSGDQGVSNNFSLVMKDGSVQIQADDGRGKYRDRLTMLAHSMLPTEQNSLVSDKIVGIRQLAAATMLNGISNITVGTDNLKPYNTAVTEISFDYDLGTAYANAGPTMRSILAQAVMGGASSSESLDSGISQDQLQAAVDRLLSESRIHLVLYIGVTDKNYYGINLLMAIDRFGVRSHSTMWLTNINGAVYIP